MLRCFLSLTLLLSPVLGVADEAEEVKNEVTSEPPAPNEVLDFARLAIKQGRYLQAQELLTTLPAGATAIHREEANYLLAYTLEKNGETVRAHVLYRAGLARWPDGPRSRDALFRLAESGASNGDCSDALKKLRKLSKTKPLTERDHKKIAINKGVCALERNRLSKGLGLIDRTLQHMQANELAYYQAKAHAHLTLFLFEESLQLSFQVNERRQIKRLAKRAQLIGQAERHVIAIVTLEEPEWIVQGLLTLGSAYEATAVDLLAARPPRRLSDEQEVMFRQSLKDQVEILLIKALRHYERGLDVILRLQWSTPHQSSLEQNLQRARQRVENLSSTTPH
jgi:tetratricopeptide (TPR) repeat protein